MTKTILIRIGILTALLLTGISLPAQENKNDAPVGTTVTDIDGNVYKTVTIGSQVWMAENLKTTRYRNGDLIGTTSPATLDISGESTPKYQWAYAGDESNVATYGRLYTWYAVNDSRNIAPTGWHVSTDAEWRTLVGFLGGAGMAGGKLKEAGTAHWKSSNTGATNGSGFTALPAGSRYNDKGFIQIGECGHHWTATEVVEDNSCAWRWLLAWDNSLAHRGYSGKRAGWPVRCVRDAPALPSASLAAPENTKPTNK